MLVWHSRLRLMNLILLNTTRETVVASSPVLTDSFFGEVLVLSEMKRIKALGSRVQRLKDYMKKASGVGCSTRRKWLMDGVYSIRRDGTCS